MATKVKKKYFVTDQGMLISTSGNVGVKNGTEISRSKYYKMLKEQKEISRGIEEDGFAMGSDGTFYLALGR